MADFEKTSTPEQTEPQAGSVAVVAAVEEAPSSLRNLVAWQHYLIYGLSLAYVLFHLYVLNIRAIDPWVFRSIHIAGGSVIGFALFGFARQRPGGRYIAWYDWLLIAASLYCSYYIFNDLQALLFRAGVAPNTNDYIVAVMGILLVLELTRRTLGWELPILALIFISYGFLGPYLPGVLQHRGYAPQRLFSYIYSLNGVFGVTTQVSATYILIFVVFASFLENSGVGNYFVRFAYSLTGSARGGPAKVAVFSSALMGTVNGTSAGNVVSTGSFTIPLMRRVGYSPLFAGATEATASTGGQLLPPIMGAGAFIMAEVTGIPYSQLVWYALIPSLLYFASVFFMVDLEAIKLNLRGVPRSELPPLGGVLKQAFLFIPLILLVGSILLGYSIIRAGTVALISSVIVSWFSPEHRMGPKAISDAIFIGARNAVGMTAVCACAGIVVGVISLTGVGGRFSSLLLGAAEQSQFLAMFFTMFICIILGMGMPTTAAYAVAASVVAPGLIRLGILPIVAHMFIFYYAVVSAITPPVALAAYAAAGVANTNPMRTAVMSFRLGIAAYIVPFMFFYSPELMLIGAPLAIAQAVLTAFAGIYLLASGVQGWLMGRLHPVLRVVTLAAALLLIYGNRITDAIGVALVVLVVLVQRWLSKKAQGEGYSEEQGEQATI